MSCFRLLFSQLRMHGITSTLSKGRVQNAFLVRNLSTGEGFKNVVNNYSGLDEKTRAALILQNLSNSANISTILNNYKGGLSFAMSIREDTLKLMESKPPASSLPELKSFDSSLKDWLSTALCADNLQLRRIEFEKDSGETLEKVVSGEAVHAILTLDELKRRLNNGRRCFGLFHASMPSIPLAFVHVALTPDLAKSMPYLNTLGEVDQPTHSMFYSVNSPYASLTGLDMALKVIKSATMEYIKIHHKSVKTFCTLSPVPGFNSWLNKLGKDKSNKLDSIFAAFPKSNESSLREAVTIFNDSWPNSNSNTITSNSNLKDILIWMMANLQPPANKDNTTLPSWVSNQLFCDKIRPTILWLCAHYIANEKASSSSLPLDPVARFHLRNGAGFYSVNWMGNPALYGLKSSLGIMVNYLYDMDNSESRANEFETSNGKIRLGEQVNHVLSGK